MAQQGKGSHIKGKNYERKIAKILSKAFNVNLRRVPNSGGLNIKGDIMTEDITNMKNFPFHFELKCAERWNVRDYYKQAEHDAPKGKMPVVIFSKNNDCDFVMIKLEDFITITGERNVNTQE